MRKTVVFLILAVAGVGVRAAMASATTPPPVTTPITACGQVVTTNAVLRTDLWCAGDAVTIDGNHLSLRLDGHTITSTDGLGTGVALDSNSCTDVTIGGGTISGFAAGVGAAACAGSGNLLSRLTMTSNTWGLNLQSSLSFQVVKTTITGPNGIGPAGSFTGQVDLSQTRITVTDPGGVNFATASSGLNTIDASRLSGGAVMANSNGFVTITNSRLSGVTLDCSDSSLVVSGSHIAGGTIPEGIACGESFSDDRFVGPGSGVGIVIGSDFPSSITDSQFVGWDTAVQIDQVAGGTLTITGNSFRHNGTGVSGCTSGCPDSGGTVSGNRFVGNAGAGLVLSLGTWHIGSNTALRNGGLGIDAEGSGLTVIDDGGNVAAHNAPPQCIGVVCAPT